MDFSYTDEQLAASSVAEDVFKAVSGSKVDGSPPPNGADWFDKGSWEKLADSNLLGLNLSEDVGGSGLGVLESCSVLEMVGKHLGRVPAAATLGVAAPAIDQFGSAEQRSAFLPGVVDGSTILTSALTEANSYDSTILVTEARATGENEWTLHGQKICVPWSNVADRILVPARVGETNIRVFIVDPAAAGVEIQDEAATNGQPEGLLNLDGVVVSEKDVLGDDQTRDDVYRWLLDRATVSACAVQLGVAEQALAMTAAYISTREQFGKPLAMFQSVALRAADAYIAVECIRTTLWQAAWLLSEDRPASMSVDVAKFWASEAGQKVTASAQQLHGGMGVDTDYPLHRYTMWSKYNELFLGGAHSHLARIGAALAGSVAN